MQNDEGSENNFQTPVFTPYYRCFSARAWATRSLAAAQSSMLSLQYAEKSTSIKNSCASFAGTELS